MSTQDPGSDARRLRHSNAASRAGSSISASSARKRDKPRRRVSRKCRPSVRAWRRAPSSAAWLLTSVTQISRSERSTNAPERARAGPSHVAGAKELEGVLSASRRRRVALLSPLNSSNDPDVHARSYCDAGTLRGFEAKSRERCAHGAARRAGGKKAHADQGLARRQLRAASSPASSNNALLRVWVIAVRGEHDLAATRRGQRLHPIRTRLSRHPGS